jgi:hypothetical protein
MILSLLSLFSCCLSSPFRQCTPLGDIFGLRHQWYLFMDIDAVPLDNFLDLCGPHTFMTSIHYCKAISQHWVRTDHTQPKEVRVQKICTS